MNQTNLFRAAQADAVAKAKAGGRRKPYEASVSGRFPGASKAVLEVTEADAVAPEVLAKSIVDVAEAAQKLLAGPLKRRAIVVLIKDALAGRVSMDDIGKVLDAAAELKKTYVGGK